MVKLQRSLTIPDHQTCTIKSMQRPEEPQTMDKSES